MNTNGPHSLNSLYKYQNRVTVVVCLRRIGSVRTSVEGIVALVGEEGGTALQCRGSIIAALPSLNG